MIGKRFGRLQVLREKGRDSQRRILLLCKCDCGNEIIVRRIHLKSGHTKSCGCYKLETLSAGGKANGAKNGKKSQIYKFPSSMYHSAYNSWNHMIDRCYNNKCPAYDRYGGSGITVCDRWRFGEDGKLGFDCFMEDMGNKSYPETDYSIDRFPDPAGNYEPTNARWATALQQANNRRPRRMAA